MNSTLPNTPSSHRDHTEYFRAGSLAFGMTSFQLITVIMALLITACIAFYAGIIYSRMTDTAYSEDFTAFWQAWDIIEDDFYRTPPDEQERVYSAIQGMLTSLNDPYTTFSPPVQADANEEFLSGVFGGIGAVVQQTEAGEIVVVQVIEGNPAAQVGMLPGDIIRAVDGALIVGLDVNQTVELIRGEVGTNVTVTIYRPDEEREYTFNITRSIIQRPVVLARMIEDVGYLYLSDFSAVATEQLTRELRALLSQKPRAVILDMRGNGGGLLDQAVNVADLFLDNGLVLSERNRKGTLQEFFSQSGDIGENVPLVVLIDGGTASASEIVAGAMQDRDRAVLVGQPSFGKASVQQINRLNGGAELRITVASWFTPAEQDINGKGLTPDVLIEGDAFDDEGNDLVLQEAIQYIDLQYPETEITATPLPMFGG